MQQSFRRVLTTFVVSALALLAPSFGVNAVTVVQTFSVVPNQIDVGQTSTLQLTVGAIPFGTPGETVFIDKSASVITLLSGIGPTVTITGASLGDVNLLGGPGIIAQATFLYPNPGTFPASYSFTLGGIISCVNGTCADPTTATGSDSINIVVNSPVPQVPLPTALPLFATGLGALGLLLVRRKMKGAAIAA